MRKKNFSKKLLSMALAGSLVVGMTSTLSGCGSKKNGTVTLDIYSMLANYSGIQSGWGADLLKQKFNVKLNYVQSDSGTFDTRMETGDLGDIVVFGNDNNEYVQAVNNKALYNWEEDNLLKDYGPYIKKHLSAALKKNKNLTKQITKGKSDALYGFGGNAAATNDDHQSFIYTWDIRWDLYKQLGYPKVKNLDDLEQLLKDMQKLCPKDDSGNKTYGLSMWPDWDDAMVMYVKAAATAYFGYDELGIGLYDSNTGEYHDALEENGPYLTMLKFFNRLYQDGLIDPDSMTQTVDQVGEKVRNGGVFFSIFNYAGSLVYNSQEHQSAGKMMCSLKPTEASPIVYGMNMQGGDHIWSIGAKSEYPELAMEVINFLSTPEGYMDMQYGPKGECWNYDKNGNTYFTDLGKKCHGNANTKMGSKHKGKYQDGTIQINNTTWSIDAENPESVKGETYNCESWKSNNEKASCDVEQDWRDKTGAKTVNEYMEQGKYTVAPGTSYSAESKSDELKTTWGQVTDNIKADSWKAIYAKTNKAYDEIVSKMIRTTKKYGYDKCLKWSKDEAAKRRALELEATQK